MFIMDLEETYRQGSRGSAQEGFLAYRSWGFEHQTTFPAATSV